MEELSATGHLARMICKRGWRAVQAVRANASTMRNQPSDSPPLRWRQE